ncbi:hypothetical protein [Noviherbaspirillum aerium]|uniref:hypothetical protein n=1 Tax=Noviherbaspirillum aerium TaxID=2588497 RepID=UPI00124BCDD1|nr:hypothetical protein [Noviherbaspirillum aerium]
MASNPFTGRSVGADRLFALGSAVWHISFTENEIVPDCESAYGYHDLPWARRSIVRFMFGSPRAALLSLALHSNASRFFRTPPTIRFGFLIILKR